MTGTPDLDIPILWFSLEDQADALIYTAHGRISNATFQYRAAHDVLALSFLISNQTPDDPFDLRLKTLIPHLTNSSKWLDWCSSRLARTLSGLSAADYGLACNAWRWLTGNRLLVDSTSLCPVGLTAAKGYQVGVEQAWQVVNAVTSHDQ
ncbi:hypothetical protein [Lentzea sp. NPDC004782]|uniref:hypothetical protein n=1 Tax=Lentzea sp. NPDC004782 TaxID=3154458 RepID=UPI0033B204D5